MGDGLIEPRVATRGYVDLRLFSDAEPPENDPQQVVGTKRPGDGRQRILRRAQFLGEELDRRRHGRDVQRRLTGLGFDTKLTGQFDP